MPLNLPGPRCDQGQALLRGGIRLHEKRSAGQHQSDSIADSAAPDGHHHDSVCRAIGGGRGGIDADLEPLIFPRCLALWLANSKLSAGDRRAFERIGAVGIALHHHSGREHHCQRHGRENKADNFQAVAVCHGSPLNIVPCVLFGQVQVQNALAG